MKVLFVSYGGGHIEMCLPVMRALRDLVPGCELHLLALTTAGAAARRAGEHPLGFADLCTGPEGERARRFGAQLLEGDGHPDVPREESIAYLGMNFLEWVETLGEDAARERWRAGGRQGFLPLRAMRRLLSELRPDVVVASNSPRTEQAAIEAARELGIPSLSMVDLFALPGDPYLTRPVHADRITVLSEATRGNLAAAGVEAARIVVTGNPAFDVLAGEEARAAGQRLRAERGWEGKRVVLWAGHLEPLDAEPHWAGAGLGQAVQDRLLAWVLARDDACLAIRYHPNEWQRFTAPLAHPRVHWSQPDREGLLPVLAAADAVVVQITTVGAQAHAAGKAVLALAFSPFVQRTGLDYGRLGLGVSVPRLDALVPLLAHHVAPPGAAAGHAGTPGSAARSVAREVAQMAGARIGRHAS